MPRSPIARRRLAGTAVALLALFASPWPRGVGVEALLGRLLAAWHRVGAAVEEPPAGASEPTDPEPSEPEPTDPAADPADPQEGDDRGPSIDPVGNSGGAAAGAPRGAHR